MIHKSFDEHVIGDRVVGRGRTVTEADVVNFCYFTGNWFEIHSNVEYAKQAEYGQRLVQGSLVFSIIPGLVPLDPQFIIAFYGVDRIRFLKPVFIGDTIRPVMEIVDMRALDDQKGVIDIQVTAFNQHDVAVQSSIFKMLVRRKALVTAGVGQDEGGTSA